MRLTTPLLVAVLLLFADNAFACAVCSAREDAARIAFIGTTVFLSVLPVGLIFGVAWWLRKESRERDQRREARLGHPARDRA